MQVRYGEMIKLQPPVFRKAKKADRPQICNCESILFTFNGGSWLSKCVGHSGWFTGQLKIDTSEDYPC